MRGLASAIAVFCLCIAAAFAFPPHGGGSGNAPLNCATTPSQDGCAIVSQSGTTFSSTVQDNNGQTFRFHGGTLQVNTGAGFGDWGGAAQLQINNGNGSGTSYVAEVCQTPNYTLWRKFNSLPLVVSPTVTLANKFHNVTQGINYNNLRDMTQDTGVLHNGDTLTIDALPGGLPIYYTGGRIQRDNLTLTVATGAVLGCTVDEDNAIITTDTNGNANQVAHVTLNLNTAQLAYAQSFGSDGLHGINVGHVCHLTAGSCDGTGSPSYVINGGYIHDNDFGIQSPQGDGTEASLTITNTIFEHNGNASDSAPTHNLYIGTATSALNLIGVKSYCVGYPASDQSTSGFEIKYRGKSATYTGVTATQVSLNGFTDCTDTAPIEQSCGGIANYGGTGAGNGIVIEMGLNSSTSSVPAQVGAIRWGAEAPGGLPNCPAGGAGWPTNTLLLQNFIVVLDYTLVTPMALYNPQGYSATAQNGIVVCNGSQTCDFAHIFPAGTTNGGGITFYASRAVALAGGQTWATPCTGETTTLCPLPSPP